MNDPLTKAMLELEAAETAAYNARCAVHDLLPDDPRERITAVREWQVGYGMQLPASVNIIITAEFEERRNLRQIKR